MELDRGQAGALARAVPNAITLLRIALVPVWLYFAFQLRQASALGAPAGRAPVVLTFVAIGLSDLVDGWFARRWGVSSRLGALLDAVADKLAQVAAVTFLSLLPSGAFAPLPLWLLATLVVRDALLGGGWLLTHWLHRKVDVEHRWHGKASSFLLFCLIVGVCAGARGAGVVLGCALVALLVASSTGAYLRAGWRQLSLTREGAPAAPGSDRRPPSGAARGDAW